MSDRDNDIFFVYLADTDFVSIIMSCTYEKIFTQNLIAIYTNTGDLAHIIHRKMPAV